MDLSGCYPQTKLDSSALAATEKLTTLYLPQMARQLAGIALIIKYTDRPFSHRSVSGCNKPKEKKKKKR